jgi:hypothetical protein
MIIIKEVGGPISSITTDGERSFVSPQVLKELHQLNIETNFIKANYLHHIRIIDNVIKTLRNMFNGDVNRMLNPEEMQRQSMI